MSHALPGGIVARLEHLGTEVLTWVEQHRDASLAEQEQGVLEIVRAALPGLLAEVLLASMTGLQQPQASWRQPCPACGQRTKVQSWRPREVLTVCGRVAFERPWYHCQRCRHGWSPVDATLDLPSQRRLSAGLRDWVVELGARTSFRDAASVLERLTGLAVAPETVRQQTEGQGRVMETAQHVASVQVAKTQEAAEPVDPAPGVLVVETDGVMVRFLDGWHEVKLGLVGGHQNGKTVAPSYVAARASPDAFGPRLLAEAARRGALEVVAWGGPLTGRGLAVLRTVVVLGDGAVWIWNLAAEHFGERIEIVDFYHASEHLWVVARALAGDGTAAAQAWAGQHIQAMLTVGIAPVLTALAAVTAPTPEAAAVLRRERGYFRTNAARMAYPTFRQQGLPIGSGAIEAGAKHLVQQRMKRPGARWSEPGAQAVLNVRSRLLSHLPLAS